MLEHAINIYKEMLQKSIEEGKEPDFDQESPFSQKNALKESLKFRQYDDSLESLRAPVLSADSSDRHQEAVFETEQGTKYQVSSQGTGWRLTCCNSEQERLEVPDSFDGRPLIEVAPFAFSKLPSRQLILPESIETINQRAIDHCPALQEIALPVHMAHFDAHWISVCNELRRVILPADIDTLRIDWFSDMRNLTIVVGPRARSVTRHQLLKPGAISFEVSQENQFLSYSEGAFYNADKSVLLALVEQRTRFAVHPNCRTIAPRAFSNAQDLAEVLLPDALQEIGSYAFSNTSLESFYAPVGLLSLGDHAFAQSQKMAQVQLNEGLTCIGDSCFLQTGISYLTIPDSVSSLGRAVATWQHNPVLSVDAKSRYYHTDGLGGLYSRISDSESQGSNGWNFQEYCLCEESSYQVKAGTVSLADGCFLNSFHLQKVALPEGLTSIGADAFLGCRSLTEVVFPSTLETIGSRAFLDTNIQSVFLPAVFREMDDTSLATRDVGESTQEPSLQQVVVSPDCWRYCVESGFLCERKPDGALKGILYVGAGGDVELPANITEISGCLFLGVSRITKLTLHDGISRFDPNAFLVKKAMPVVCVHLTEPVDGHDTVEIEFPKAAQCRSAYLACFNVGVIEPERIYYYADNLALWADSAYDRGRIVMSRLADPVFLSDDHREKFEQYLHRNAQGFGKALIDYDDAVTLGSLIEQSYVDHDMLSELVDYAHEHGNTPMSSHLLNIMHQRFGQNSFESLYEL